jgi:hypothetical protein
MHQNQFSQTGDESPGYYITFLTIFVLVYYIVNISFYVRYTETVLPYGDPFTYTVEHFNILDALGKSYFGTIAHTALGHYYWYWLADFSIALFFPIIIKEPFSLSIINFFMYWFASLSFFRLARVMGGSNGISFLIGMLVWIFPINYGFSDYSSVPVMGLDSLFSGALFVALAHLLIFAHKPLRVNAILAGCAFGVAIWGRGNSLPVVAMVAFVPVIFIFYKALKDKSESLTKNVQLFALIAIGLTVHFYWANWAPLNHYYSHHATMATMSSWTLENARVWLLNIPGFMFWRDEGSNTTITLTILSHLLVLLTTYRALFKLKNLSNTNRIFLKLLATTGVFIYIVTYAINIFFFTDPMATIYNVLLIYRPMLNALALFFIFWLMIFFSHYKPAFPRYMVTIVLVGMWSFAIYFTESQTLWAQGKDRPPPKEVENFSTDMDNFLEGGSLSLLWYGYYNYQIINYYRLKNDLDAVTIQKGKFFDGLWAGLDFSEDSRIRARKEIRDQFEKAKVIIIPKYLDLYYQHQPYPLYKFREEIANYLNAPDSPKFVIKQILNDHAGAQLLVLQREDIAKGQGVPLKLPYGFRTPLKTEKLIMQTSFNYIKLNNVVLLEKEKDPDEQPAIFIRENLDTGNAHSITGAFATIKPDHTYHISMWVKALGRKNFRLQINDTFGKMGSVLEAEITEGFHTPNMSSWGGAKAIDGSIGENNFGWYKINFNFMIDPQDDDQDDDQVYFQLILGIAPGQLTYDGDGKSGLLVSSFKME